MRESKRRGRDGRKIKGNKGKGQKDRIPPTVGFASKAMRSKAPSTYTCFIIKALF
jgi:hypothetical protein